MKWWHWLILELLIIFVVGGLIYLYPGEFEDSCGIALCGYVTIFGIERYRYIKGNKE